MPMLPRSRAHRERTARLLTPGAAGGRSALVAPEPRALRTLQTPEVVIDEMPFSVLDPMTVATSGPWRLRYAGQLQPITWDAAAAGTGTTAFDVLVDGASIGTVSVPSSTTEDVFDIGDPLLPKGSVIQIDLTAAGMHEGAVIGMSVKR